LRAAEASVRSKGQNLQSYAIMPVQRVPRYLLLLRELLKWTLDDHPDKANLDLALQHVDESARHMNAAIQMREASRELKQLQQQFIGSVDLLQRGRKLIKVRAVWCVLCVVVVRKTCAQHPLV
jgi:hypothetical protein